MDDNKNQNQTNPTASDYQKILDEYAASVKPEDNQTPQNKTEDESISVSLKETTSAKVETEKPIVPQTSNTLIDDLEKEIIPKIPDEAPEKSSIPELKSINSPQLESPIHPSLAANLENEEEDHQPKPVVEITPEPVSSLSTETSQPEKTPEEIKAEINRLLTEDETKSDNSDTTSPVKKSSIGKVFFIFALVLFLVVAAGLAYFLFLVPSNTAKNKTDDSNSSVTPTLSETNESGTCELNNKTYQIGESFQSADGCNTCSCSSAGVIACTEMACAGTPTVTSATPSATTSSLKKYTNSTYKFSLSYPSTWTVDTKLSENQIFSVSSPEKIKSINDPNRYEGYTGDDFSVSIYKNYQTTLTNNKTLESYLSNKTNFSTFSKTKIGNADAYSATELGMTDYPTYFIVRGTNLFQIGSNTDFSSVEKQILNTLTFN